MVVILREAVASDLEWVLSQIPRLHEFGPPSSRTIEQMNAGEERDLRKAFDELASKDRFLRIAIDAESQERLGFLSGTVLQDFFTGEPHAHVSDLVVAKHGEGRGIGRLLLDGIDAWARSRGLRFVTLSVFPQNQRARSLYEHVGYQPDTLRMLKLL